MYAISNSNYTNKLYIFVHHVVDYNLKMKIVNEFKYNLLLMFRLLLKSRPPNVLYYQLDAR